MHGERKKERKRRPKGRRGGGRPRWLMWRAYCIDYASVSVCVCVYMYVCCACSKMMWDLCPVCWIFVADYTVIVLCCHCNTVDTRMRSCGEGRRYSL